MSVQHHPAHAGGLMDGRRSFVSLIMPVWQPRPTWLHEAVSSALSQQGCEIELIAVDDGNATSVAEILADVGDPRLRIVRIEHGGPNTARNAGIAAARGDLIRFVDADDVTVADSTMHLMRMMEGDRVIAYGATAVTDEHLKVKYTIATDLQGDVVLPCLLGRFRTRLPALLFPRAVIEKAGPWDPAFPVSGDWDFVLRAVEHARVAGDQQVVVYYRRHAASVTGHADIAMGESSRERVIAKYLERHPHDRGTAVERRARSAQWLDRGFQYWRAGCYGASLARLSRALLKDPVAAAPAVVRFALR